MISLRNLVKVFADSGGGGDGEVRAVDDVSVDVESGEFVTLLGPSGCGKTTTLRMLAGLAEPDSGQILIRDNLLFDREKGINLASHRRGLGMVFQSYAIWPHMTVFKNVAFPLGGGRFRRGGHINKKEVRKRVGEVLELVQLGGLENRPATDLSGGQQQRLALARALVTRPDVLLLDEPLSNLDAKLRESMRFELKKIQREIGITTVYVTHDQAEALGLSNKIAVMNQGKIEQIGHPRVIYETPETHFVADFIGVSNFVPGVVKDTTAEGQWSVATDQGELIVESAATVTTGEAVTISVRPEHVRMKAQEERGDPVPNVWHGRVEARAFEGDSVQHQVRVGDLLLRVQTNPSVAVNTGTDVELELPAQWCALIPQPSTA